MIAKIIIILFSMFLSLIYMGSPGKDQQADNPIVKEPVIPTTESGKADAEAEAADNNMPGAAEAQEPANAAARTPESPNTIYEAAEPVNAPSAAATIEPSYDSSAAATIEPSYDSSVAATIELPYDSSAATALETPYYPTAAPTTAPTSTLPAEPAAGPANTSPAEPAITSPADLYNSGDQNEGEAFSDF